MAGTELDRLDRGGDAREAGEHHDQHVGGVRVQSLDAAQARCLAAELQVDHRIGRRARGAQQVLQGLEAGGMRHRITAPLEGASEGACEGCVVLDDQESACGYDLGISGHSVLVLPR
jgi:hypothetical protein